jgi:putative ABC transport system permease protein
MIFSRDLLAECVAVLRNHKLRSFLTIFGVMWGIAAFTFSHAVLEGFQSEQRKKFAAVGKDLVVVDGGKTSYSEAGSTLGREIRLQPEDASLLLRQVRTIGSASPELIRSDLAIVRRGARMDASVHGIWPVYQRMRSVALSGGRPINNADEEQARRVCLLGADLASNPLGSSPTLPAAIELGHVPYTVIGVVRKQPQGASLRGSDDTKLFLPLSSMLRDFPAGSSAAAAGVALVVQPLSPEYHERVVADMRAVLARKYGFGAEDPDALSVFDTIETARNVDSVFSGLALFGDISALTTVLMGAIGLMNILLISVRERTREIGIRRSVGARARHIFAQLLWEGVILSTAGGALGLAAGASFALLLGLIPIPGFAAPRLALAPAVSACAFIVCVGIGASAYPAIQGTRIDPVEALRRA